MTNRELIDLLNQLPLDKEIFISRGEYGPCRIETVPRETIVNMMSDGRSCWETLYPELHDEREDGFPLGYVIVV